MVGAASQFHGGDSEYQDQSRVVTCPRSVIVALRAAALESFASGPQGGAEMYGILFGTHGGNEVQIAAFQAVDFQSAMAGATPLSKGEHQAFGAALAATARSSDPKELEPVGWFRVHPHSELSLTARDLEIAGAFFPAPHHALMIMRPSDSLNTLVRFFYRDAGGTLTADSPFCEFDVPPALDAPTPVKMPDAREAPSDVPPSLDSAPAPQKLEQPQIDDAHMMFLPEQPPPAHRNLKLVWALLLAVALGLFGAWYWLARPSDKLALHIFDAGGQLQIMWEPVADGEAGNLEIVDGGARYSITLDPEQLRGGTFTYARHSESVNVRLEASRRGAGTLVEIASFLGTNTAPAELNPPPSGSASRTAPPPRAEAEKPTEIVVSVPVQIPQAAPPKFTPLAKLSAPPKFNAPATMASRSTNPAPDISAPPVVAQSAPAPVPGTVVTLSPPVEKPAPPAAKPPGVPPQAGAAKPAVATAPPRAPSTPVAPASGRIIWIGRLQKNQELAINGKSCSTGTLIGELPGKPVKFSLSPGDLSNDGIVLYTANPQYANNVIESPGAQNGWNKTIYTWNPKYANDVTVREAPAAQNQWNRVVLQSKNPKISVVVIDWALVN